MRRSPQEVALMIATIFKRSGEKRAKISEKTIKLLSKRVRLHSSFIVSLADEINNYNLYLIELDTGGFGIIPSKSLEGARSITARRYFDSDEMTHIRSKEMIDFSFLNDLKYEVESEASDEINEYE